MIRGIGSRLSQSVGGQGQLRVIVMLALALALAAGDQTIAGAVAPDLKATLHIDNAQIGLLVTAASLMGAATTLPFGLLADRVVRVRLLIGCVIEWSASIVLAGSAQSYLMLLLAQIALGAGIGAASPVVASLTGDFFPPAERGRVYGFILAGEFAGAGVGLLIAGLVAAGWGWRGAFWVLALPGPILVLALLRLMPEPARGAMGDLPQVPIDQVARGSSCPSWSRRPGSLRTTPWYSTPTRPADHWRGQCATCCRSAAMCC